jgi:RNA polymerase sigma factor (sigma-70 family)
MIATHGATADRDLVQAVRAGDDAAFEELFRRYQPRIAAYVRRMARDSARAEDIAQDAFLSALRRMRATDAEIAFKPWIFEIARNAAIDHWRRSSRAEEVSVDADAELRQSDRLRLIGPAGPDSVLVHKERLEHLRGAIDELSDVHSRILVMRELEGLSYREIAEQLDLSRSSVESALFRARRRLESEYSDISEGRRCIAMRGVMARMAEGIRNRRDETRLTRHARRCHVCRHRARELGVDPLPGLEGLRRKAAALLPLPFLTRRGEAAQGGAAAGGQGAGGLSALLPTGAQVGAVVAERAAAIVAAAALAGAGGVALGGADVLGGERDPAPTPAVEQRGPGSGAEAGPGAAPAASGHPSAGAVAGASGSNDGADPRQGGGPEQELSGAAGAGGADAPGAGGAGAPDVPGGGLGEQGPDGTGEVGLPKLPDGPPGIGGGPPRGPAAEPPALPDPSGPAPRVPDPPRDVPRLPEPPGAPNVGAPDVPPHPPGASSAPQAPVEQPTAPDLPQPDAGGQLNAVTAIGGG